MGGMKGGALLVLGIPFALYAAWQVTAATQIGSLASEAPTDTSASPEQLAASSAKAATGANETRKAIEVTWQYRAAGPADASPDGTVTAVVKAASARTADLSDLDRFLSGTEKPTFTGNLKRRFDAWTGEQADLRRDAQAVADWLAQPPTVASPADATKAIESAHTLITRYATRSRFADKSQVSVWRLRARLAVIDALTALADAQYRSAIRVKLPLEPGTNAGTTAVDTLKGLKAQITSLNADLKQADEDKVPLVKSFRTTIDAKTTGADEYAAREELLTLFAKDDLFTNATGAAPWLKRVAAQYAKTKDTMVRALIREKVQEFADAFVPAVVRLDEEVLLRGKPVPRKDIVISYEPKLAAKAVRAQLSSDATGFNEFELARKPPGYNQLVKFAAGEYELKDLAPTELSKAAVAFNSERAKLSERTNAPRWTAKSVGELKNKCEAQKDLVDQLRTPDSGVAGPGPKIATRLAGLLGGAEACRELFEDGP